MNYGTIAVLALTLAGQAAAPAKTPPRQPKQYTIEQFLNTISIGGASFSADETRILFSSNKTGIWNAYTMPVSGGPWTPVTSSTTDSTYAVSFFPHDDRILITHDQAGNELNHLYVRNVSGDMRDLTPGEKLKASFVGWTPDGSAFYVQTNERDPKLFDVYRYDAKSYERTLFYENKDAYFPADISDDGKWMALVKVNGTNDQDLFVWNAASKTTTLISKHSGQALYNPADFDAASASLYYTTNDTGEFARLRRYDLASGQHADVEKADWDIQAAEFSQNGTYRATIINRDARPQVIIYETATGRPVPVPQIPNAGISSLRFARKCVMASSFSPRATRSLLSRSARVARPNPSLIFAATDSAASRICETWSSRRQPTRSISTFSRSAANSAASKNPNATSCAAAAAPAHQTHAETPPSIPYPGSSPPA